MLSYERTDDASGIRERTRQCRQRQRASARPDDFGKCRAAGADALFDFTDSALAERVREFAPEGVDGLWETSGHHDFSLVSRVAAVGCRAVVTSASSCPSVPLSALYVNDVSLLGFVISRASAADLADAAVLTNRMLAADQLSRATTLRLRSIRASRVPFHS